jgi:hypothetical protein
MRMSSQRWTAGESQMVNRREFLITGMAAASTLSVATAVEASASQRATAEFALPSHAPLYKVIYDERFSDSVTFGLAARRIGLAAQAISGDITALWYHDLFPRWQREPVAIAGLTSQGPIFCLERLAWDVGMRVVLRTEHRSRQKRSMEHVVCGPPGMERWARTLARSGDAWASQVANLVASSCPERPVVAARRTATAASVEGLPQRLEPLTSWIIAPVRRA